MESSSSKNKNVKSLICAIDLIYDFNMTSWIYILYDAFPLISKRF